jgi:hypothetical protein
MTCTFTHLTSFGGFMPPMNSLASLDELFSTDAWARNILGLVIVLGLFLTTILTIAWSMCSYISHFRRVGKEISTEQYATSSRYATSLTATTYKRTSSLRHVVFRLRTKSQCGPLMFHVDGDPFVRSQRMILVLLTLLASLFFSTLFFVLTIKPACTSQEDLSCSRISYLCPSCYELHGVTDCGDLPAPAEVCANYRSSTITSAAVAEGVCENRPLSLCQLRGGEDYVDPVNSICSMGTFITLDKNYVQATTGDTISSACVAYEPTLAQTVMKSLFVTGLTLPVILVLNAIFSSLRSPHERAIAGEFITSSKNVRHRRPQRYSARYQTFQAQLVYLTVRGRAGGLPALSVPYQKGLQPGTVAQEGPYSSG